MRTTAALTIVVLLGAPAVSGLTAIQDEEGQLRFVADEGPLKARALDGEPRLAGRALDANATTFPEEILEPWRGYDRVLSAHLTGNGSALVYDAAGGLVLTVDSSPGADADPPDRPTREASTTPAGPGDDRDPSAPARDPGPVHQEAGSVDGTVPSLEPAGTSPGHPLDLPVSNDEEPAPQGDPAGDEGRAWIRWVSLAGALLLAAGSAVASWLRDRETVPKAPAGEAPDAGPDAYVWLHPGTSGSGERSRGRPRVPPRRRRQGDRETEDGDRRSRVAFDPRGSGPGDRRWN